jgi:hypothetical protein
MKKGLATLGKLTIHLDRAQLKAALIGKSFTVTEQEDGHDHDNTYIIVNILPLKESYPVEVRDKDGPASVTWQYCLGDVLEHLGVLAFVAA